jgi:hypothetical protein
MNIDFSCVALIHDPELLAYIDKLQKLIKEKTGSSFNMNHWAPHISVGHGVDISAEQLSLLKEELQNVLSNELSLVLPVKGFYIMKKETIKLPYTPYVINISLEPTEQIRKLSKSICDILEKYNVNWSFAGENGVDFLRLTLASRDLTEDGAKWFTNYCKENPCEIKEVTIDSIALVAFSEKEDGGEIFYEQALRARV